MAQSVSDWKPDIIHAHNFPGNIIASIVKKKCGAPIVWFCNEPVLYEPATIDREQMVLLRLYRIWERYHLRNIDVIVANSKYTASRIMKYFNRSALVVYSGIDTHWLSPSPKVKRSGLLTVSRIKPGKHIEQFRDIMHHIWEKNPSVTLTIIGTGDDAYVLDIHKKLNDPRICFKGSVTNTELLRLYQRAAVYTFVNYDEPLGITIPEVMSCGVPVVAYRGGGVTETVSDGKTGYLVPPKQATQFAARVLELLKNASKSQSMGLAGRDRAVNIFSIHAMNDAVFRIYHDVISNAKNV